MTETTLHAIKMAAMAIFVTSIMYRLYIMQRNTKHWNGLGRAMRIENAVLLIIGSWVILRSVFPILGHDLVRAVVWLSLACVTIRVAYLLPRVPLRVAETKGNRERRLDATAVKQAITGEHQAETGLVQAATELDLTKRGHEMTRRGGVMDKHASGQEEHEADLVLREAALVRTQEGEVPIPVALEKVVESITHIEQVVGDVPEIKADVKEVRKRVVDEGTS